MRDIAVELAAWHSAGQRAAIATVVQTWKSAPRRPGASMAVSESGEAIGSVSGGCVEGAVYVLAEQVIETGIPARETYGVSDDDAFAVGLTCGGILDVYVQPSFAELPLVVEAIEQRRSIAVASVMADGRVLVVGPDEEPDEDPVATAARELLARGETGVVTVGDADVFVQSFAAPPHMMIFGAIDFAAAVARIGKFLGYHVTVCDARATFATPKRFPAADEVVVRWPHQYLDEAETDERTVICVLTHDPKFDVPVLERALAAPAAYIGAMGSRRTHTDRLARLREAGVTEAQLERLSSPIGLDLGADTPEETAVAIAAEIIQLTRGGSGDRLLGGSAPIHKERPPAHERVR